MTLNRPQFLETLRDLAGREVPYLHQGKDPAIGLDCISAPRYAIELQGIELPKPLRDVWDNYHDRPDGEKMLKIMREHLAEIDPLELLPTDILVLMYRRNPQHIAVRMDDGQIFEMFRSGTNKGKAIIWPLDPRRRIAACFRIPDFA